MRIRTQQQRAPSNDVNPNCENERQDKARHKNERERKFPMPCGDWLSIAIIRQIWTMKDLRIQKTE